MARGIMLARFGVALVVVLAALALAGCQRGYATGSLSSDPGEGSTIADKVFRLITPVIGEQVTAPNPDDAPYEPYLYGRLLQTEEVHPEFGAILIAASEDSQVQYGYADGSVLVFYTSPRPGPQLPPPGPNTGTKLDAVKIGRP